MSAYVILATETNKEHFSHQSDNIAVKLLLKRLIQFLLALEQLRPVPDYIVHVFKLET